MAGGEVREEGMRIPSSRASAPRCGPHRPRTLRAARRTHTACGREDGLRTTRSAARCSAGGAHWRAYSRSQGPDIFSRRSRNSSGLLAEQLRQILDVVWHRFDLCLERSDLVMAHWRRPTRRSGSGRRLTTLRGDVVYRSFAVRRLCRPTLDTAVVCWPRVWLYAAVQLLGPIRPQGPWAAAG